MWPFPVTVTNYAICNLVLFHLGLLRGHTPKYSQLIKTTQYKPPRHVRSQLAVAALITGNFMVNIFEKWIDPTGEKHKDVARHLKEKVEYMIKNPGWRLFA